MKRYFFILLILLQASSAYAATFYIRAGASGANDGSDWTNAWTNTPTTWVRGDTYLFSAGTYSGLILNTAESGTSVITIQKATVESHGADVGWDDVYATGQAVFGQSSSPYGFVYISTGYWTIDGVTGSDKTGHGFRINDDSVAAYRYHIRFKTNVNISHVNIRHVEIGPDALRNPGCDCGLYANETATPFVVSDITIQYCYLHHMGDVGVTVATGSNTFIGWTLEYNSFAWLGRGGFKDGICGTLGQSNHGSGIEFYNMDGAIIRYNTMSDTVSSSSSTLGTTGWIGYYGSGSYDNVSIYGNVFYNTAGYSNPSCWSNGIVYNTSGAGTANNLKIYNNTFANLACSQILGISHDISGNEFKNNIIYNTAGTPRYTGMARDYNASNDDISGDMNLQTLLSDPFVDSANADFHLSGHTTVGTILSFPYNVDADGVTRTAWDRGAYEYLPGGITYTVTPSAGANGALDPNSPQKITAGETTLFTVMPYSGYSASVGGTCGGSLVGTVYTTNPITADCTIEATFTQDSPISPTAYTVTPSAGPHGSISPSASQTVFPGASAQFTVTPYNGYSASVGGTCGGSLVGAIYTTNAVTADCTVNAAFTKGRRK